MIVKKKGGMLTFFSPFLQFCRELKLILAHLPRLSSLYVGYYK